jgi:hypothetical protein
MATADELHPTLDETFRDYAWNYFALHAEQRLKTFHFFIILVTAIVGGFLLILRYGHTHKWIALLGFFLAFLSFVFWKLDVRTRALVKNAEEALKVLDAGHELPDSGGAPHALRLFDRDDYFTSRAPRFPLFSAHFSYSRCFNYLFFVVGLIGFGGGVAGLMYLPV